VAPAGQLWDYRRQEKIADLNIDIGRYPQLSADKSIVLGERSDNALIFHDLSYFIEEATR